jgi:hypothetical protein
VQRERIRLLVFPKELFKFPGHMTTDTDDTSSPIHYNYDMK